MGERNYRAAGIDSDRLGRPGIGIHLLRGTTIDHAIRNGAQMHEVREFAGYARLGITDIEQNRSAVG